jgi:predicted SAM-dependent methyltransferase
MRLIQTQGGQTNLHVWRGGRSYERQKGPIYRKEWNNLRFTLSRQPADELEVLYFDVRRPLPYAAESFDAVDLFHIVEHLTQEEAAAFLRQVRRILKPAGILRLSTPDLEDVCRTYLQRLEDHERCPTESSLIRYEWSVLELIDQIVRTESGGLMRRFKQDGRFDPEYAKRRFGDVFDEFYVPDSGKAEKKGPRSGGFLPAPCVEMGPRTRHAAPWPLT